MLRRLTALAFVIAALLAVTATAQARWLGGFHPLSTNVAYVKRNLWHATTTLVWVKNHPQFGTRHSRAVLVKNATWQRRWAQNRLAVLVPRVQTAGHYAGWSCITNGAYPGAAHEGNGYNGSYTGPLGMTTPWAGHMPPGSDWVHSDVSAVYAIAEQEAAKHGFSYSWMQGQWPETFPPCAKYF